MSSTDSGFPASIPASLLEIGAPGKSRDPDMPARVVQAGDQSFRLLDHPKGADFCMHPTDTREEWEFISPQTLENVLLPALREQGVDEHGLTYLRDRYTRVDADRQTPQRNEYNGKVSYKFRRGYEENDGLITLSAAGMQIADQRSQRLGPNPSAYQVHELMRSIWGSSKQLDEVLEEQRQRMPASDYEQFSQFVNETVRPGTIAQELRGFLNTAVSFAQAYATDTSDEFMRQAAATLIIDLEDRREQFRTVAPEADLKWIDALLATAVKGPARNEIIPGLIRGLEAMSAALIKKITSDPSVDLIPPSSPSRPGQPPTPPDPGATPPSTGPKIK